MGFMRHLKKDVEIRPEQKWDYITLQDFKSTSCFKPLAYGYLYFSLILSVTVYALDSFTAVNLLVFNKWSSEITPSISFTAARWIFSVCIILSTLNLIYEHIRAQLIMRRGSVVECYLDNLAVRLECIRWGKGRGWKRFLVFAELTKSKKGAEYIALFTYFSFQSWVRVLICSGPRQVVNALTLYSVYTSKLSASGDDVGSTLLDLFDKIRDLAEENYQQALILSAMLFTLVIWAFSFLSLMMAFLFFLFYLWSYIPKSDGGLSGFCARKITKRLMKIVAQKVNNAFAEEERRRKKKELKAAQKAGEMPPTELTATIPNLGDDKLPTMPMMSRSDTLPTLPEYTSQPGTPGNFELNKIDQKRPPPPRTHMMASVPPSANNYSSRAPLLNYAAELGVSNAPPAGYVAGLGAGNNMPSNQAPTIPNIPEMGGGGAFGDDFSSLMRSGANGSNFGSGPGAPPPRQLTRTNTAGSLMANQNAYGAAYSMAARTASPAPFANGNMPQRVQSPAIYGNGPQRMQSPAPYAGGPQRMQSPAPYANGPQRMQSPAPYANAPQRMQSPAPYSNVPQRMQSPAPYQPMGHRANTSSSSDRFMSYGGNVGRASPAPSVQSMQGNGFEGANEPRMPPPARSATSPLPPRGPGGNPGYSSLAPQRNMTQPAPAMQHQRQDSDQSYASYFERSGTPSQQQRQPQQQQAPSQPSYGNNSNWNMDVESQRGPGQY